MNIEIKDLYQLLIAECRYGYTRNNHLMPDGAYDHVKKYLPIMLKEDARFAVNTAKQLCEECISEQLVKFSDGIDDEFKSRQKALDFIQEMLDFVHMYEFSLWQPYNYDKYLSNKDKDDEPRYTILKINYKNTIKEGYERSGVDPADVETVIGRDLTKNNVLDYLFRDILNLKDDDTITYKKWRSKTGESTKFIFEDRQEAYYITGGDC